MVVKAAIGGAGISDVLEGGGDDGKDAVDDDKEVAEKGLEETEEEGGGEEEGDVSKIMSWFCNNGLVPSLTIREDFFVSVGLLGIGPLFSFLFKRLLVKSTGFAQRLAAS